jgi:peptidoglycan/LPS O-acetylase OafA/YrhL
VTIPPQTYRPDIDGLRAIAVLMVVGRHVGVPLMPGGFTGVDIFFVISGYLITGMLVREQIDTGRIGIAAFYARRVRRLLPALGTVTAVTLLLGFAALLPDEQIALARSALASLAFSANFYFWTLHQNYFADPSALLPLQHLWTLAVEEQFYVLWPLALVLLAGLAVRTKIDTVRVIGIALAAAGLVSLALSIVLSQRTPIAAFLLLPTRAWELGAGCLLALAPALPARPARPLAPVGLIAIVLAMMLFDAATPFPSFYALLPVLGAVALIAGGGVAPDGTVSRLLASRPLVGLGKISYGWYLWHWPLLAFARNLRGIEPSLQRDAALAVVALALAAAMSRGLETPVRALRVAVFRTPRGALAGGAAILLVCASLSVALHAWGGRPLPAGSILAQYRAARGGAVRDFPFCDGLRRLRRCEAGAADGAPAILLWGDSHAAHLTEGLDRAARAADLKIVARTIGGCAPGGFPAALHGHGDPVWVDCATFNEAVIRSIPSLQSEYGLRGVVIAGEWSDRWTGWDRQLEAHVNEIRRSGLRVVLMRDVPVFPADFITCASRRGPDACALPRDEVERRVATTEAGLTRIGAGKPDVRIWSPLDALCPERRCPAVLGGRLLYRNRNHLTIDGSALLAPAMAPTLAWLAEAPSRR